MREKHFYLQCRMDGMDDMTLEKATELRAAWFRAFPEMNKYMQPRECGSRDPKKRDDPNRYEACTLTGRLRRYCSYNSALNLNFQGLAADGCKLAMWDLWRAGFKIVNFIHDEFIFEFPEEQASVLLEQAERIMIDSMQRILPDVKITADGALMHIWSKAAKRKMDDNGSVLAWDEPEEDDDETDNDYEESTCEVLNKTAAVPIAPTFW